LNAGHIPLHWVGDSVAPYDRLRGGLARVNPLVSTRLPHPWALSDAPAGFVERLLGQVVGIEIVVTRLLGKWKVSQNQPPANRDGVVRGLAEAGHAGMAALVAAGGG